MKHPKFVNIKRNSMYYGALDRDESDYQEV